MGKILHIDTSNNKSINVGFENDGINKVLISDSVILKSEAALPLIEKILKENDIDLGQISEITVKIDSGSYTGLRVGASIANTLGFILKIPVNGKQVGELVEPVYN